VPVIPVADGSVYPESLDDRFSRPPTNPSTCELSVLHDAYATKYCVCSPAVRSELDPGYRRQDLWMVSDVRIGCGITWSLVRHLRTAAILHSNLVPTLVLR
jgi:hypothetical protein